MLFKGGMNGKEHIGSGFIAGFLGGSHARF
jgi:hypothetical protein